MSIQNMHSQKRKKYQRAVNRLVRTLNQDIQNDWLWNGRLLFLKNGIHLNLLMIIAVVFLLLV